MFAANTVRDEVVLLVRDGDEYFDHGRLSLSYLKNIVPTVGDHLTLHPDEVGIGACRVQARYLADLTPTDGGGPYASFWILVVEEVEGEHLFELDRIVQRIYKAEFNIIPHGEPPSALGDTLDRSNRDPDYWTFERKEREARRAGMQSQEKARKD